MGTVALSYSVHHENNGAREQQVHEMLSMLKERSGDTTALHIVLEGCRHADVCQIISYLA